MEFHFEKLNNEPSSQLWPKKNFYQFVVVCAAITVNCFQYMQLFSTCDSKVQRNPHPHTQHYFVNWMENWCNLFWLTTFIYPKLTAKYCSSIIDGQSLCLFTCFYIQHSFSQLGHFTFFSALCVQLINVNYRQRWRFYRLLNDIVPRK